MVYSNNFGQTRVGIRFVSQVVNAIDADATAFIAAAGITDLTQAAAISTLVNDLKTYGIWSKMKALYPFVGGSATSHKFNLKDPRDLNAAFRLTFYGGGIHSSTGYQLNGSNSWGDANLVPSSVLTNNNISLGFYSRTNRTGANKTIIGSFDSSITSGLYLYPRYTDNKAYFGLSDDGNGNFPTVTSTLGFYQGARNNSSTQSLSNINGTNYSFTYNSKSLPTTPFYIGSIGYNSTSYVDTLELAFAYVGDNLSPTDLSNYYTTVQKFQTTLGRQVGTPYVSDSDAQSFLNVAGITDLTQATAINTLVTDLKAAGIWTKMKAVYPFVGGTATSHKWNLKDPRDLNAAFRLVFNDGWTHTSTGSTSNGSNGYADTKLVPLYQQSGSSGHFSLYSRTSNASTTTYGSQGIYNLSSNCSYIIIRRGVDNIIGGAMWSENNSSGAFTTTTTPDGRGHYMISRISNNNLSFYKNGSSIISNTSSQNSPTLSMNSYYLGSNNNNGNPDSYDNKEISFSSIGEGLTSAEANSLYNIIQLYQTTLGRQVNTPLVSDGDAQSFLNAAGITSYTQANAVNTLVTDLKSGGLWTKMKALYPMVGGTSTSHKWNLKDPRDTNDAYRLSFSGGWTHGSTGAKPNGANAYADTFIVPKNVFNSTTFEHVGYYSRTNTSLTTPPYRYDLGVDNYDASGNYTGGLSMIIRRDTNVTLYGSDYGTLATYRIATTTTSDSLGFFLGSQTGTNIKLYKNNSILSTNTGVSNASYNMLSNSSTRSIWIGTMNELNYTTQNRWTDKETGLISIGEGLNDSEASLLYTAVQKFNTSLGRQVGTPVYNNGLVLTLDAGNANSYPGTGTTWFDLASGNNGTLVNGPTYDINNGGSLYFDGTNKYTDISYTKINITNKITINSWVYFLSQPSTTGNPNIVDKWDWPNNKRSFHLGTENGYLATSISYDGLFDNRIVCSDNSSIVLNQWINITMTYDGRTLKLYKNGSLIQSSSFTQDRNIFLDITTNIFLGRSRGTEGSSRHLNARISGVKIYSNSLSATEILNNFNSTRGRFGL